MKKTLLLLLVLIMLLVSCKDSVANKAVLRLDFDPTSTVIYYDIELRDLKGNSVVKERLYKDNLSADGKWALMVSEGTYSIEVYSYDSDEKASGYCYLDKIEISSEKDSVIDINLEDVLVDNFKINYTLSNKNFTFTHENLILEKLSDVYIKKVYEGKNGSFDIKDIAIGKYLATLNYKITTAEGVSAEYVDYEIVEIKEPGAKDIVLASGGDLSFVIKDGLGNPVDIANLLIENGTLDPKYPDMVFVDSSKKVTVSLPEDISLDKYEIEWSADGNDCPVLNVDGNKVSFVMNDISVFTLNVSVKSKSGGIYEFGNKSILIEAEN